MDMVAAHGWTLVQIITPKTLPQRVKKECWEERDKTLEDTAKTSEIVQSSAKLNGGVRLEDCRAQGIFEVWRDASSWNAPPRPVRTGRFDGGKHQATAVEVFCTAWPSRTLQLAL